MRLIDADRLKQEIATIMPSRIDVNLVVDAQPDAVVHCKDCKFRNTDYCGAFLPKLVQDDWYCADGEAKE